MKASNLKINYLDFLLLDIILLIATKMKKIPAPIKNIKEDILTVFGITVNLLANLIVEMLNINRIPWNSGFVLRV